jgi:hypothetical protein
MKAEPNSMEFEQFLKLCIDANELLTSLKHSPKLQGKKPTSLKAAAVHYLARKRGIPVTLHDLYLIYGCMQQTIIPLERIIKEEAEKQQN